MRKPIRVAVINSHPIQYFAPLYRALTREPWIDLTVFFASRGPLIGAFDEEFGKHIEWDVPLLEGYHHEFISPADADRGPHDQAFAPRLARRILAREFDLVWTHGYRTKLAATAIGAAMLRGVRRAIRGESHLQERRGRLSTAARWALLRPFYRTFDAALFIGSRNREFYDWCGVRPARLFHVPYVVDNDFFRPTAEQRLARRRAVRAELGIADDAVAIVYASKLTPRKRASDLVAAFERVREEHRRAVLVIVGTGAEEESLRIQVSGRQIPGVIFGGFWNQSQMRELFCAADVFVLPSQSEPWGLVVNEAMCASLPIIVTADVGCWPDLVVPGVNGFVYDVGDVSALTSHLLEFVNNDERRVRMGAASAALIATWSIREAVAGVRNACAALFPGLVVTS